MEKSFDKSLPTSVYILKMSNYGSLSKNGGGGEKSILKRQFLSIHSTYPPRRHQKLEICSSLCLDQIYS